MNVTITFGNPATPPLGYGVWRVKKWGDPVLVADAALSTEIVNTSNFQVVPVWVAETKTFSAISNYSVYNASDIERLKAAQTADVADVFGKIVHAGTGVATMWTGDEGIDWQNATEWRAGSQLWGGQLCAATNTTYPVTLKYPNRDGIQTVICRKVLPFARSDFGKSFATHPWLWNKYTVAYRGDSYSETFGGIVRYLPVQCLDPRDFRFAGGVVPGAYYVPAHWLDAYP